MKIVIGFLLLALYAVTCPAHPVHSSKRVVCFWNATSMLRTGPEEFKLEDLDEAFKLCSHLIYGFAGINVTTGEIACLNPSVDFDEGLGMYNKILEFRQRFPHVKILLSIGGAADPEVDTHKYLTVTETVPARTKFIESVNTLLEHYDFDGFDLTWNFPTTKYYIKRTELSPDEKFQDAKEAEHKQGFTNLVRELKHQLQFHDKKSLSITILPHVNASVYLDVKSLIPSVDFVNLFSFDKKTPTRNPTEADISSPIVENFGGVADDSIVKDVKYWIDNGAPAHKLVIGIPTFGRTWRLTKDSQRDGKPPIKTDGPGAAADGTLTPGMMSYPEICARFKDDAVNKLNVHIQPSKNFASYAYLSYNEKNDTEGIWIAYEDGLTANIKSNYVRSQGLGGIAIFDISLDDFSGVCTGKRYPILQQPRISFLQ